VILPQRPNKMKRITPKQKKYINPYTEDISLFYSNNQLATV